MILEIKKAHRRVAEIAEGFIFFLSAERTERKNNISAEKEQINITDF